MSSKNGPARSMPPKPPPELKLAMEPEDIELLAENAKEVHARSVECIAEIRALLESHRSLCWCLNLHSSPVFLLFTLLATLTEKEEVCSYHGSVP